MYRILFLNTKTHLKKNLILSCVVHLDATLTLSKSVRRRRARDWTDVVIWKLLFILTLLPGLFLDHLRCRRVVPYSLHPPSRTGGSVCPPSETLFSSSWFLWTRLFPRPYPHPSGRRPPKLSWSSIVTCYSSWSPFLRVDW